MSRWHAGTSCGESIVLRKSRRMGRRWREQNRSADTALGVLTGGRASGCAGLRAGATTGGSSTTAELREAAAPKFPPRAVECDTLLSNVRYCGWR